MLSCGFPLVAVFRRPRHFVQVGVVALDDYLLVRRDVDAADQRHCVLEDELTSMNLPPALQHD